MSGLVNDALKALAPSLANLTKLTTAWMNGIQFYLAQDVPLDFGHTLYADSPWALTSVSQRQFWTPGAWRTMEAAELAAFCRWIFPIGERRASLRQNSDAVHGF